MPTQLVPGVHLNVSHHEYLSSKALGSSALESLNISPRHYRYSMAEPGHDTDSTFLGTAFHTALLQPELFNKQYIYEPDLVTLCPDAKLPRATKIYKEWVADAQASGQRVIRSDTADTIRRMVTSVHEHPHASATLAKATKREVTLIWDTDGRLCRGRADAMDDGILVDVKSTRNLRTFSPFVISKMGYHRQFAWYGAGLDRLTGERARHYIHVVVENAMPYDVGVFVMDEEAVALGTADNNRLLGVLAECERSNEWPGMFPKLERGTLTDAAISMFDSGEDE